MLESPDVTLVPEPFDLYASQHPLPANAAKIRILEELAARLAARPDLRILDIGCVGLQPFELWAPLLGRYRPRLTAVDVAGLDSARAALRRLGWHDDVTLIECSGYTLSRCFAPASFDVVIATQVLEHVARLDRFMNEVAAVLVPGGECFFCFDSAHYRSRYDPALPGRLARNAVKKGLSLVGREEHYDLPWTAEEVADAAARAGLATQAVGYYNVAGLKGVCASGTGPARNALIRQWYALEKKLNESDVAHANRAAFVVVYLHASKLAARPVMSP